MDTNRFRRAIGTLDKIRKGQINLRNTQEGSHRGYFRGV